MNFEINDIVISTRFGIGQVTGIETLSGSGQKFLSVSCRDSHAKILIPQKELATLRKLARPEELDQALAQLASSEEWPTFACKKDRVLYFKQQVDHQSLVERVQLVRHLQELGDKGKVEDSILQSVESILIKEIEMVYNISYSEASQKVHALRSAA